MKHETRKRTFRRQQYLPCAPPLGDHRASRPRGHLGLDDEFRQPLAHAAGHRHPPLPAVHLVGGRRSQDHCRHPRQPHWAQVVPDPHQSFKAQKSPAGAGLSWSLNVRMRQARSCDASHQCSLPSTAETSQSSVGLRQCPGRSVPRCGRCRSAHPAHPARHPRFAPARRQ